MFLLGKWGELIRGEWVGNLIVFTSSNCVVSDFRPFVLELALKLLTEVFHPAFILIDIGEVFYVETLFILYSLLLPLSY